MSEPKITIDIENNTPKKSYEIEEFGIICENNIKTFLCKFCKNNKNIDCIKKTKCNHEICNACFFKTDDRLNIVCEDCKQETEQILENLKHTNYNRGIKYIKQNPKIIFISSCAGFCCLTISFLIIYLVNLIHINSENMNNQSNISNYSNRSNVYLLLN